MDDGQLLRYSRHILLDEIGIEGQNALLQAHVLIVGAGISGIGSAYHLSTQLPGRSFLVLEALDGFGGTWKVHRYPGIRSDSDLYTFGFRFKPWTGAPIATAELGVVRSVVAGVASAAEFSGPG